MWPLTAQWTAAVTTRGGRPVARPGSAKIRVLSCVTASSGEKRKLPAGRRKTGTCAASVNIVNGGEVDSGGHVSNGKRFYVVGE